MFCSSQYASLVLLLLNLFFSFVKFILKYFILLRVTVNGIISLISYPDCSLLMCRNTTDFFLIDPVTIHLLVLKVFLRPHVIVKYCFTSYFLIWLGFCQVQEGPIPTPCSVGTRPLPYLLRENQTLHPVGNTTYLRPVSLDSPPFPANLLAWHIPIKKSPHQAPYKF